MFVLKYRCGDKFMINAFLMEFYDDYEKGNMENLIQFTNKTLPNDGTRDLFIGCVVILFSIANAFKGRYDASRENLLDIVLAAKEKVGKSNLLAFYLDRVNKKKGINKYFKDVLNSPDLDKYVDVIIDYLEQFKPKFISSLKNNKNLKDYTKKSE